VALLSLLEKLEIGGRRTQAVGETPQLTTNETKQLDRCAARTRSSVTGSNFDIIRDDPETKAQSSKKLPKYKVFKFQGLVIGVQPIEQAIGKSVSRRIGASILGQPGNLAQFPDIPKHPPLQIVECLA
jgi:hypothetical protein